MGKNSILSKQTVKSNGRLTATGKLHKADLFILVTISDEPNADGANTEITTNMSGEVMQDVLSTIVRLNTVNANLN